MKYLYLCVISLALATAFIKKEIDKKYIPAVILKGLASVVFVLLGFLGSKLCGDGRVAGFVIAGLICGCIADVMLNLRLVFEKQGQPIFLVGILIFLAGHVLYLLALIPRCSCKLICLAAGIVLTFFTMKWIFTKVTANKTFRIFGIVYIGAIMIMTCFALGILFTAFSSHALVYALGAVLFLASDIILILNTFGSESKDSLRYANIWLYYLGQLLIALSLQLI